MPTDVVMGIVFAIGGALVGFVLGYLLFGRSAKVNQRELESLKSALDQKRAQLETAQQRVDLLQEAVEDKTVRERRALETLQRALQSDPARPVEENPTDKPRPV